MVGNRKSIPIPESDTKGQESDTCQIKISIPPIDFYALFFSSSVRTGVIAICQDLAR